MYSKMSWNSSNDFLDWKNNKPEFFGQRFERLSTNFLQFCTCENEKLKFSEGRRAYEKGVQWEYCTRTPEDK